MLSIKLAEEIVHQTMTRLHHNINVISPEGVILASGDLERINSIHEGAIEVVKTGKSLIINEEAANQFHNCKPGINLPIKYHDDLIGVIGITGEPDELLEIANLVQLTTEMLVHQVLTESESEWQRKNGDFIFKALIENEPIQNAIIERIQKLPFKMENPYQILLISEEENNSINSLFLNLEDIFYKQPILFGQMDLNVYYVLLIGSSVHNLEEILKKIIRLRKKLMFQIGVSPIVRSLSDLPYAYKGAKSALNLTSEREQLIYFEEIEIYTLLKDQKSEEVSLFLSRVLKDSNEKMLHTLKAFFESDLQLNTCAKMLGIHRHTLTYRLNKIYESTGYHPQKFEDAFVLKLALTLQQNK